MIRIIADDRENAGEVIPILRNQPSVAVRIERLPVADFVVADRFCVERKTVADFRRSILDGRLFRQTSALAQSGRKAVILLEGDREELEGHGMTRESLQGALISIGAFYGIPVLRCRNIAETAWLIVDLGRQAERVARGGLSRAGYRPKGRRARQLFILQGLPGIGPDRAARLLDRFGSVRAVMCASTNELTAVDGIGEGTARRMRDLLEPDESGRS
jgi:ERCC4-type nuclease